MKTYLTYGFATALANAVLTIVLYLAGFHSDATRLKTAQGVGLVAMVTIATLGIWLGTKARREELPASEEFGYGSALGAGFMITLFAALFGIVTTILYTTVINPEFVDVIVEAQMAEIQARGLSGEQADGAEKMIRRMFHPAIQAALGFIMALFMGTIISLATAAFLRRPAAVLAAEPPPLS
jgi:hypothetical protein